MKSFFKSLQEDEHQKALLTVSILIMISILLLLLVSLKSPEKKVVTHDLIEIQAIEVEGFSAILTTEKSEEGRSSDQNNTIISSTVLATNQADHVFSFQGGDQQEGDLGEVFGSDGIDFKSSQAISHRRIMQEPELNGNSQEEGDIALALWVNASGQVVRTTYEASQSTSGSEYLITLAKRAAKTMVYNSKKNAEMEFVGIKVFTFKKT